MALDAVYVPAGGPPQQIRIIKSSMDRTAGLGRGEIVQDTGVIDLRVDEVPRPQEGDLLVIGGTLIGGEIVGGETRELYGEPVGDVEGLTWTIGTSLLP